MSDTDAAYIARADCGCIVAATVDEPRYRETVSKEIADWVRRGYAVEHTTVANAKADPYFLTFPCPLDGNHDQQALAAHPPEEPAG